MYSRFAIYFTPKPDDALAQFGAAWLGWDSATGETVPHPNVPGINLAVITKTPRKYGFHGTIKAPLRLAEGFTLQDLEDDLQDFCASNAPVTLPGLHPARIGHFVALVPTGPAQALSALASRAVRKFDLFRAPPTDEELTKRRKARLTPEQDVNLLRWGYPYVMDEFRFHMTLTGRLDDDHADAVTEIAATQLASTPLSGFRIDALTLLGESEEDGRFHQLHRVTLSG